MIAALGALAFNVGAAADILGHSGSILEDTVWHNTDEQFVSGDVTVYPQAILTVEASATVRLAAGSDDEAGGADADRAEMIVSGTPIADGREAFLVTCTESIVKTQLSARPRCGAYNGRVGLRAHAAWLKRKGSKTADQRPLVSPGLSLRRRRQVVT